MMVAMEFLLVGLGNPDDYIGTPHNIGRDFISGMVSHGKHQWTSIGSGRVSSLLIGSHIVACAVSDGYMNETGNDLGALLRHTDPSRVLVVHDEADLQPGTAKVSFGRSHGGHKGVASVADALGANKFFRLRVGIGKHDDLADYVLRPMSDEVRQSATQALRQTFPDAIATMAKHHNVTSSPPALSSRRTDPSVPA